MSRPWNGISQQHKERLGRIFDGMAVVDDLLEASEGAELVAAPSRRVRLEDLFKLATRRDGHVDARLKARLKFDAGLRSDFDLILKQTSVCHFPAVAAAASGALTDREAGGYSVQIRKTRRRGAQVYVLVSRKPGGPANVGWALIARRPDGDVLKLPLPEPLEGVAQVLVESDSEIVTAIGERETVLDII